MSTPIELPDGHKAFLRESRELKVKHRRLIEAASMAAASVIARLPQDLPTDPDELAKVPMESLNLTRHEANALMELQDATIVALLESWTLDQPLPTMDTVGDLDTELYDALAQATRDRGAEIAKGADLGVNPDPKADSSDSRPSDGPSEDVEELRSPET